MNLEVELIASVVKGRPPPAHLPAPRLIKIFIASERDEFFEERKQLLESVGPELQSIYDDMGIEVLLVDMQYGTIKNPDDDPRLAELFIEEINASYRQSRGCFLILLVGNEYNAGWIPTKFSESTFISLAAHCSSLNEFYEHKGHCYILKATSEETAQDDWQKTNGIKIRGLLKIAAENAIKNNQNDIDILYVLKSTSERQFDYGLSLDPEGNAIISIICECKNIEKTIKNDQCQNLKKKIISSLPNANILNFKIDNINSELNESYEIYLNDLRNQVIERIQQLVNSSVEKNPEIKSRKKMVQEIYSESLTHLSLLREIKPLEQTDEIIQRIKKLITVGTKNKHGPIFIRGGRLTGKSSILSTIYNNIDNWLNKTTLKIVRLCTSTPRSAYSVELLRILCQHIGFLSGNNDGNLPREASFNPLHLNNWFTQILRGIEEQETISSNDNDNNNNNNRQNIVILIDDLHRLHTLESEIIVALSWLPLQLPPGIHFIVTTSLKLETLKLTPLQKERFKNHDILIDIGDNRRRSSASSPGVYAEYGEYGDNILKNNTNKENTMEEYENAFDFMEKLIGKKSAIRIGSILAVTEYGLSETEILELIMPTCDDGPLLLKNGQFNFSTWCLIKRNLINYLKIHVLSGKLLFSWKWICKDLARKRYLTTLAQSRTLHIEIATTLFFCDGETEKCESEDDKSISKKTNSIILQDDNDKNKIKELNENKEQNEEEEEEEENNDKFIDSNIEPIKSTPFQSIPQSQDITYTIRHVEEAWLHLLRAGDVEKLKRLAVCAFDFLLAAVQMISVSYLRCVLEHSRQYLLERDLELVYYAIRNSSDALTRDPLQLGGQLISWLRPVVEDGGDLVSIMITAAMAWCDGYAAPLLVPLNGWLQSPLPLQIRALTCPQGAKLIEIAPSGQHIVIVPSELSSQCDAQLWHVMSGQLVYTFKGHSNPISCLAVTQQSQYLLTGSDDTTIIVWDMKEFNMKIRICEHIAPVLSLIPALNNTVIVSGGEDSRIIATSLLNGKVLMKVDHHRGPVTSLKIDKAGEVLVSGSVDGNVCLWSLENFKLLNNIVLPSSINTLDISSDSVFLLAACDDEKLYLRSLATGTEIHTLRGHQGPIKSICLAKDCRRAIAGGIDGSISVFDIHSGKLIRSLSANLSADVTSVKVTDKDDFLVTASGNRVIYWSFRDEDIPKLKKTKNHHKQEQTIQHHTAPITCIDISRDGAMAVTGGVDSLVNLWQLNTHELMLSLEGHIASVTCVTFSASGLFAASGSEDKTVRVWGLTLGFVVATFRHQSPVLAVISMLDGRRVVSSDRSGSIRVWAADTGTMIQSVCGPGRCFAVTSDMRYTVCGAGDNQVQIVSLGAGPEEKYKISHSQEITCLVVTPDSQSLITGSRDMSLKVWQLNGGKLSQILVGHSDHVTCVAVAVLDKSIVISGSRDANLIVWDINTGADLHTLIGHLGYITCVKLSGDGTLAVSGSEDKSIFVWDTKKGTSINSIMLHVPIFSLELSTDCSRLALHLLDQQCMPILCLHNTPAQYVKLPSYVAPRDLRPPGPKRPARRLLKKEVSLDTYTWQKKYGHITSGIMVAAVEDRLKRRFSVSASMEEISKAGLADSQTSLGKSQQAALAQSQHFDQLEALWNKQSPPPRQRRTLCKQTSLQAPRISDSDEEDFPG